MADQISSLRQRFTALSDDELQNIAITGGLTDQASELLEQELRRRGIDDVGEYKEHLRRVDQERLEKKQKALQQKEKSIRLYSRMGYGMNIGWSLCSICSEKRKERRRNNHCKCDLVTIGVDYCPGSAAYLALSTETISDRGSKSVGYLVACASSADQDQEQKWSQLKKSRGGVSNWRTSARR